MDILIAFVTLTALLVLFDVAVLRYGADSRDGFDNPGIVSARRIR